MKFAELIPLTAAIVNLLLAVFVLSRDARSALNRVFALWGLAVTLWNVGTYFMYHVTDPVTAYRWACFLQVGVIFLPISNLHLCLLIARTSIGRWLFYCYLLHAGLLVSLFTGHFLSGVRWVGYAYYSVAGPGFWVYTVIYSVSTTATMSLLYWKQRTLPKLHRTRLRALLTAIGILVVFGMNDILPILGVDYYPFTRFKIYPLGSMAAIFYGIIIGYSVLQHRLLDVNVTLGKIAVRLVRMLFLFLMAFCLLLAVALFAPDRFPAFAFFSSLAVLFISSMTASIFFPRLFGPGDEALERRILGDRFEYQERLRDFIGLMHRYTDADELLDKLHDLLVNTVQVRSYKLVLLDEKMRSFSLQRSFPEEPVTQLPELRIDSPVFKLFQTRNLSHLAFNITYISPDETPLENSVRQQLKEFRAEHCFPLLSGEQPVGLFLVGEKANEEFYTPHDLSLLISLAQNLSLVISQIRLKNQILLAQELDLLGRMSKGLAHDLNNLVVPVSTYLQLAMETGGKLDGIAELLPIAMRNIQTIRAYIKEALFFSNTLSLQLSKGRLDKTIRLAVALIESKLKQKNIPVTLELVSEATIQMDEVLVQRVISNLLSNAIDATPPGSSIHIDLHYLAKTDASRDWLRLEIVDHGSGISRENLKRLFTPYFTTKDKGDEGRGFGLGLAITRKIVHLHGGNLNIASEEKKGTTVQVDLPSRQVSKLNPVLAAEL